MRIGLVLGLCVILTACDTPLFEPMGQSTRDEIRVTRDAIRLAGPEGFCIDDASLSVSETDAFVVFGSCDAIAESNQAKRPGTRAIATVSVTQREDQTVSISGRSDALATFFETDDGRETLSVTGSSANVETIRSYSENGTVLIRVSDVDGGRQLGISDTYWRSYFDAKTSIVAVSVMGSAAAPISEAEGLALLLEFTKEIKAGQGDRLSTSGKTGPTAILRRLFN